MCFKCKMYLNVVYYITYYSYSKLVECVFLLRLRSQTQTWGHGHSEAHVAVQHTFDVLHVYKHVDRRGNSWISIAVTGIPQLPLVTFWTVNIVQCLDLQVLNNTSLLPWICFICLWLCHIYLLIHAKEILTDKHKRKKHKVNYNNLIIG